MNKWISILTCAVCILTAAYPDEVMPPVETEAAIPASDPTQPPAQQPDQQTRKQVGKAAADGSTAASSNVGKYVLAGSAIAIGVAALILISRHSGHHRHH